MINLKIKSTVCEKVETWEDERNLRLKILQVY